MESLGNRPDKGFTLLEVLVAVTIFGMVTAAAYGLFYSAITTQQTALREMEMIQRARYVMDSLERDLTNVFFRDETSYNVAITRLIEQMEQQRLDAEATGNWDNFHATYGHPEDSYRPDGDNEADPSIGNPYEKGRLIDLQFVGKEGEELDSINFAIRTPLRVGERYNPWGVARVQYTVDGGVLIRSVEDVEADQRGIEGEVLEPSEPPLHSILAEGITQFNLTYAFWFDNQWYETNEWASSNRQIRNPRYYASGHDFGFERPPDDYSLRPGDAGWNQYLNDLNSEPLDRLPAYVRLRLSLKDPSEKGREISYTRIYRMSPSVETWIPGTDLTEDQRDEERKSRDDSYNVIYPGASGSES